MPVPLTPMLHHSPNSHILSSLFRSGHIFPGGSAWALHLQIYLLVHVIAASFVRGTTTSALGVMCRWPPSAYQTSSALLGRQHPEPAMVQASVVLEESSNVVVAEMRATRLSLVELSARCQLRALAA
jgi:hypothetical protein